ncbi:Eco57I restriction-modification methylase domain-containing protein [Helicobacter zhangjianzhongii]|uniref:Eco57I restriction-modification methylase domain-containing protein n=1 Tax=Helicobacter zhangjianzhongii TaxID=2974574 RepID=UPI002553E5A6|nr:DNA methyltransferase [Helicobacter sp. CPD2-1]MDL0080330.1 BREX-1 system adenine-specific DNA-methyltransferase PglX [Helicobacter sp. CPD2-1]
MSTFSKGDSVLGEQCGSVAKITKETSPTASGVPCFVKGTNAKFANLPQFSQSYHSTTATPRILEEENQASLSLRADNGGVAIHNQKVDSSDEAFLSSLRDFALAKSWQSTQSAKADSRIFTQTAQSLNNLQSENAQNAFDSQVAGGRIFDEKAGLCSGEQGDKTRVSIDAVSHKLPAFSQKANAQNAASQDNTKREFSLRLLSRLLFCKFLEKKGIIDTAIFSTALSGNYYHEVLEPLFFTTLNTPKNARDYALLDPHIAALLKQIPYLNGGLFAPQASDFYSTSRPTAYHTTLKVPNAPLAELFTLLESYHFSIDESTPDAQEVGLNPELLGMVFESLLSELFTDNRKDSTSSLRKSTGSYYTPREIVRYMCRTSLYQYLLSKMDSAFGLESRISSPRLCDSHSRLISARGSKSHDSISKILESTIGDKTAAQKSCREQTALESTFDTTNAHLSSLRGSEATEAIHPTPSLRALREQSVAIHKDKAQKIDSSGLPRSLTTSRNDSKNAANKKADSSPNTPTPSLRADEIGAAIHKLIFHQDPSHLPPTTHAQILAALSTLKVLDPACGSGAFPIGLMQEILDLQDLLGDTRSPYTRKLEILQSNIYGIDIQPMATEISRLRCFLSLIVDEDRDSIAPLPNLEFKFLSANSLLPLPQAPTNLDKTNYDKIMQDLLKIRKDNFSADTTDKAQLEKDYHKAAKNLAKSLVFSQDEQSPLTSWNPYDPHSVAGFFDSEYMFGLSGFDIVIGNPPYGATYPAEHKPIFKKHYKSARTINEREAKRLYPTQWQDKLQVGSLNTYSLFIEQSYNHCATQGIVSLIVPMSVTASESMQGLHKLLLNNCESIWVSSYGYRPNQIFLNAATNVSIISFIKSHTKCQHLYTTQINKRYKHQSIEAILQNLAFTDSLPYIKSGRLPKISYQIEADILRKMYSLDSTIDSVVSEAKSAKAIYYRSSGGLYYKLATSFATHSSKEVALFLQSKYSKAVGAFMSSTLFYWWWLINSNWLDNRGYEILDFPLPLANLSDETLHKLESTYAEYEADLKANAKPYRSLGELAYYARKSKHIIDKIDRLICPLYGLTEQETEFIINYDLQFRTDD